MPRTCTICSHAKRKQIEELLVQGGSLRDIAGRYGTTKSTLERHQGHIAETIQQVRNSNDVKRAASLIDQLEELSEIADGILQGAVKAKDGELALKALDRRHKQVELGARLAGEFKADQPSLTDAERANRASAILSRGKIRLVDNKVA